MKLLLTFFIVFSFIISLISHPLILSLVLVFRPVAVGALFYFSISVWIFNAIILIYLGGIIVLFLYISILSNEDKVFFTLNLFVSSLVFLFITIVRGRAVKHGARGHFNRIPLRLAYLYKNLYFWGIGFIILYLLLTLFRSVKFAEGHKGTLIKLSN